MKSSPDICKITNRIKTKASETKTSDKENKTKTNEFFS